MKKQYLDKELWDLRPIERRKLRDSPGWAVQGDEGEADESATELQGEDRQSGDGEEEDDDGDDDEYVDEEGEGAEREDDEADQEEEIDEVDETDDEIGPRGETKSKVKGKKYRQRDMYRSLDGSALLALGEPSRRAYALNIVVTYD